MATPHRKRCRRYDEPGHAHFLTFSCYRRQPFLAGDRGRGWFADALAAALRKHAFHLWAYVVMPEHVHLVVWPTLAQYSVGAFLKSVKQPVALRAVAHVRRSAAAFLQRMRDRQPNGAEHFRFWQRGGGYDRNLWSPHQVWDKIDYTHENPVRRGLCARPEDWLWSSAADLAGARTGPIGVNLTHLPVDLRQCDF